jgi:hypothetical protein
MQWFFRMNPVPRKPPHFIMQMRAGRSAGVPGEGDHRVRIDFFSRFRQQYGVMPLEGQVTGAVVNADQIAVAMIRPGEEDCPDLGGMNRGADRHGDIVAAVINQPAAAERVEPPSHAGGDDTVVDRRLAGRLCGNRQ